MSRGSVNDTAADWAAARAGDVPSFREAAGVFAHIGLLSFGGPAGQIALMHRMLVEERRWLDEARFLHALNYCMLLPGPEAMQLATYVGWLLQGMRGGLIAGLLFLLPGALVITALSILYVHASHLPVVVGLLWGIKAAVLAFVLEALLRVAKRALKTRFALAVALAAFAAIAFLHVPFPAIVLGAVGLGIARSRIVPAAGGTLPSPAEPGTSWASDARRAAWTALAWLGIWFGPLVVLRLALGGQSVFTREAWFFSKMATVTFGGAYAVLAYVGQQAVDVYGWLAPDEMLTGLGLAETTPGPLILVLVFVGFLGGTRLSGLDPLAGGLAGAAVALWFTFVPCFLWIFAGAPFVERLRHIRWLSAALAAVTAAVVGIIANLALWFGLHVLFGQVETVRLGLIALPVPVWGSFDLRAAAVAATAALALLRWHVNLFAVLGSAALAGALLTLAS